MRRSLALAGLVAAGAAAVVLATRTGDARPVAERRTATPLRVTTTLPPWRAPGTAVTIGGFAGGRRRVVLRADGRAVASTVSGPLGRYALRFAAARPGRYRLTVRAGARTRPAGTLEVRPVVLEAVGDITFGEQVGPAIARYGPAYPWGGAISARLRSADVTIGNLETAVSTRGTAQIKQYTFRGPPAALPPLRRRAGFDVLTLANNHAVDYGREALLDTIRSVHAAGMQTIGAGSTLARARRSAFVEEGGLRIAFLGYSDVNPAGFTATADEPGTAPADVAAIEADVHAALRHADVAVCFFHWGIERRAEPTERQRLFAAACLNAGAKLVLGAHPHVLGPVARPTRRSLVAWTLGNFLFPSSGASARTAILRADLDASGVRGYRLLPVTIDGFRPELGSP